MQSNYLVTKKTFDQVNMYDQAPVYGESFKCFFTNENVDFRNYRVFTIKTKKGLETYRFYLSLKYISLGRKVISQIENKLK